MHFAIIGAGMSGLSCASRLKELGHQVSVFDKGRGAGGRMSSRRLETPLGMVKLDHGAQYFTVRDPEFAKLTRYWLQKDLITRWPAAGEDAYVGLPTMSAVIRYMSRDMDVQFGHIIRSISYDEGEWHLLNDTMVFGPFDAVILAVPAEQAGALLALVDFDLAKTALMHRSLPCWTSLFVFDEKLAINADVIRDEGNLSWAARTNAKPGREGPESWVVQASADWSTHNLEIDSERVSEAMLQELQHNAFGPLPGPIANTSHRWRYALSAGANLGSVWNPDMRLGVCGDWLIGPRVESAWLSGQQLATKIGGAVKIETEIQNTVAA